MDGSAAVGPSSAEFMSVRKGKTKLLAQRSVVSSCGCGEAIREHQEFWVLLFRQGPIYKEIGFNIGISIKPRESSILEKSEKTLYCQSFMPQPNNSHRPGPAFFFPIDGINRTRCYWEFSMISNHEETHRLMVLSQELEDMGEQK